MWKTENDEREITKEKFRMRQEIELILIKLLRKNKIMGEKNELHFFCTVTRLEN